MEGGRELAGGMPGAQMWLHYSLISHVSSAFSIISTGYVTSPFQKRVLLNVCKLFCYYYIHDIMTGKFFLFKMIVFVCFDPLCITLLFNNKIIINILFASFPTFPFIYVSTGIVSKYGQQ